MRTPLFAVVTGGGTGGHVSPALAVADALVSAGHEPGSIEFVGGRRGIEASAVPAAGFVLHQLPGRGIQRRLTLENLGAVLGIAAACAAALVMALRRRPRVVVTVGGYAGFPYALAAVIVRVPLVIVNVDAVPGAANRALGRLAKVNAVAFAGTPLPRAVVTGPPVRKEALDASRDTEATAKTRARLGIDDGRRLVVVTGGSLGAGSLNTAALDLAKRWSERSDVAIYHVAGERDLAWVRRQAERDGLLAGAASQIQYRLTGYDAGLVDALAACDVAISRAGASTVAELTVIGVPSVLVPLPGAPGDHQAKNALALEAAGAAILVPDRECSGEHLSLVLTGLIADPDALASMSAAARSLGHVDAAGRVSTLVETAASHRRGAGPR